MERKDGTKITKTTIKVWRPLVAKLEARLNETCLRRDLYLSRLLSTEVVNLDQEVAVANSPAAYNHVLERLDRLDRKAMSLALPPDVLDKVNDVCSRKNIVRDAFFNRLFLLLAASPKAIDAIFFRGYQGDWKRDVWRKFGDDSSTVDTGVLPLASLSDPFWAIREALEIDHESIELTDWVSPSDGRVVKMMDMGLGNVTLPWSLYTKYLDNGISNVDLVGFNCYVPDWQVPSHAEALKRKSEMDAIFEQL